ncbi:MAG: YqjD family protein [Pyrinomonadaceae bacterium]
MSEFEEEVKKAEKELEQSLVPFEKENVEDEFLGELRMQAQDYGQKVQDAAGKAKIYAEEKFAWAGDKFKEIQNKDPKEVIEDAKEYARQKPGQTILISAAIGLVIGMLLRRK